MTSHATRNKKSRKAIKKLRPWIKKLQDYGLFSVRENGKYGNKDFMSLALSASLNKRSIEYESSMGNTPSPRDFYHHTNSKLTTKAVESMFRRYIAEVVKLLKNFFHCSTFSIAIDKTDEPYWGEKENIYVTGGKREKSTNYAFRYLTATLVARGIEFTLYARPLTKEDTNDALLVEEAITTIQKLGIVVSRVLMDREFYNGKIIFLCKCLGVYYIIPLKKDSKFQRWAETFGPFPSLVKDYEINGEFTNLLVYEEINSKGEKEIFGFITNIEPDKIRMNAYEIVDFYRRRWAIENANKFQDNFTIHTNTTNGIVRYFFFVLAALLHNFWVLVSLMAQVFSLGKVPLNMLKDVAKTILGLAPAPNYKHAQRKLWLEILVG